MKITRTVMLVSWFFASISGGGYNQGTATVIGPFRSLEDCELGRKVVDGVNRSFTTHCWFHP